VPIFLSLFSGIGGLDLGLERAGWSCVGQVEIDEYRREVLGRWWPAVPRRDDIRRFVPDPWKRAPDLICGGFPCQDLSVAGKRAGLEGARSSLWWEFHRIVDAIRPRRVLVENVPGLLSSHAGRDFALLLASLAELGYGVAWRVLDSRYFGVPQRRRRVFVVGHLGARSAEPFLPFLEGGEGDPAESSETGEDVAGPLGGGTPGRGGFRFDLDNQGAYVFRKAQKAHDPDDVERWEQDQVSVTLDAAGHGPRTAQAVVTYAVAPESGQGADLRASEVDVAPALAASEAEQGDRGVRVAQTLSTHHRGMRQGWNSTFPVEGMTVRRLTPVECCRLQGFPDDWLGGNEPPDSPKYAALGDAVTVPVAEWIGRRLLEVHSPS
jgi:DNA (cytosine-5)-methyltransferase 1